MKEFLARIFILTIIILLWFISIPADFSDTDALLYLIVWLVMLLFLFGGDCNDGYRGE